MSFDDKTKIASATGSNTVSPGTRLNGIYEIDERLAFGGMGEVYRGHNIHTEDPVAIKIVLPEFAKDATILALFRKEASILSHLSHDAIVRYHVFTIDPGIDRPYLAMEFVNGESLADHFRNGAMDAATARKLISRIASGLSAAHDAGVIHRDLSPDNIILPGGAVEKAKIIDFGIAKSANVGGGTLLGGKFAGKYNFVSPEQLGDFGGEVTAQSDIYSLGLVLAAVLRGEALDMGGSQVEVIEKRRLIPDTSSVDPQLAPLLEAMLQPDPRNRPPSMDAIVEWLAIPAQPSSGYTPGPAPGDVTVTPYQRSTPPHSVPPRSMPPGQNMPSVGSWNPPPAASNPPGAPSTSGIGSIPPESAPSASESPFGPYQPSARPATYPPVPDPVPQRRRSRGGLYAVFAILLLGAGGAGLYYSGLLDAIMNPPARPSLVETGDDENTNDGEQAARENETEEAPTSDDVAAASETNASGEQMAMVRPGITRPEPPPVSETLDTAAARVAWLRDYSGGECFFATATSVSDNAISIEGFGMSAKPFETLLSAFETAHHVEPDIGVRLIERQQCPVANFLRELNSSTKDRPALTLSSDIIRSGDAIRGTLGNLEGRTTDILLIDNEGVVYNLAQHLRHSGEKASFNIKLGLATPSPVPQIIVAVASPDGITAAKVSRPILAATLFPRILEEIHQKKIDASATAKYFRLGGD